MHIHIILYTQRAACLVLFAVCQRSSFAVSRSEHKNASGDSTPVASRRRVQRYGLFIYRPNLSATFLKVFLKKEENGEENRSFVLRWDKKMKDAIERVQKPNLFELCRAWASSAKPTMKEWINEKWKAAHQLSTHSFFHLAILTPHIVGTLDFSLITFHFAFRRVPNS